MELKKILIELKSRYIKNFPTHLKKMKENFLSQNRKALKSHFHQLKGSGKTYGLPEVSQMSLLMEEIFKKNLSYEELKDISILCLNLYEEVYKHYSKEDIKITNDKEKRENKNTSQLEFESKPFNLSKNQGFLTLQKFFKEQKVHFKAS